MSRSFEHFHYVKNSWDEQRAEGLDPLEALIYRSNLLGSDQRITNTGGGNTSAKLAERDPLTGEPVEVLWVKGSGGDLRTSTREHFASLYQDKLLALEALYQAAPERGPKSPAEDRMVAHYGHTTFNLNPRAPSIDTPLHAFIPHAHVDHMHPNAVIAVAASRNAERLTREIWGEEMIWMPWQRPGFDLGLKLRDLCQENPGTKGILLGGHGCINWGATSKACYENTLDLIERAARYIAERDLGDQAFGGQRYPALGVPRREAILAAILPYLRGLVSTEARMIGTVQSDTATLQFVNSVDAQRLAALGTSCPDHFLRTKIKPLFVDWDPGSDDLETLKRLLREGIEQYREDYREYYSQCRRPDSPALRPASPTVCLIPGIGMITWGRNKSESRVTAEFYSCAIEVMRGAEAIDEYIALPAQEAFDIEYWLLEEAKLKRMPAEKPLAREVVVVVGSGDGIGRAAAQRVAREGAHVVCADLRLDAARAAAQLIEAGHGPGVGVAGSGLSACGQVIALEVDITRRGSVKNMFSSALLAYGGVDRVIVTAGVFLAPGQGEMDRDAMFDLSFAVNVKGAYIVATEADTIWRQQGLRGSLVLTTSVNAVVAKKGSVAYDTSKAASNHMVRELAVELAPLVNVNGLAPATVLQGSTMFPRDRVIASLKKYDLTFREDESDDVLRERLAQFYSRRTLTQQTITMEDQAEAAYLLVSGQLGKTTGQIICVDGGLQEAFLR